MMERSKFVIEASDALKMADQTGKSVEHLLPALVKQAQSLARPPISNYHVGAVGMGQSGRIFFGVNLEFPGLPLHHSVHAEQFLMISLSLHAEHSLTHLAVSAAPCGHCRQFLQETRGAQDIHILITSGDLPHSFQPLSTFLPNRFGPDELLDGETPLFLEARHNGLSLAPANVLQNGGIAKWDVLKEEALKAANESHAVYSRCPSGVALVDEEGRVYRGSYVESAAYNPSLGPVQAALVDYVAGGGGGYERIVGAVLVEGEGAVVRQEATARLLLSSVAPNCDMIVFYCVRDC